MQGLRVHGRTVLLVLCLVGISGCAENDPNRNTKWGAGIGAASGAGLGAVIGTTVGAMAGAGVGYSMDPQQGNIEKELEQKLQIQAIDLQRLEDNPLQLNVRVTLRSM